MLHLMMVRKSVVLSEMQMEQGRDGLEDTIPRTSLLSFTLREGSDESAESRML